MNPIDNMLDQVEWKPMEEKAEWHDGTRQDIPTVTHSGILQIGDVQMRVFRLSDGKAIIAAEDLAAFFGMTPEEFDASFKGKI